MKKCGLYPCRARAEKIAALEGAVAVVVGGYFACALKKDGAVWCWGSNANRELGRTTTGLCDAKPCDPVPGVVEGLPPVTQLSLGSDVACARTTSAEVYCWGNGAFGNLGTGGNSTQAPPVKVDGLSSVAEVQLGLHIDGGQGAAACARTTSGGVACWGLNIGGALGHDQGSGGDVVCGTGGSNWCNSAPSLVVPAEKGLTAASITVGVDSACAAQASGPAFCWGRNQQAQLGLAPASLTDNAFVPPTATGASGPRISGRFVNRCVVSYTGALLCWGARHNGEQPAPGEGNVIGLDAGPQSCPVASVPCQPTPPPIGVDAVEDFAGGRMFFLSTKNDGILTGSRVFRSA